MIARREADWEERLWHLTHDIVVRLSVEGDEDFDPDDLALQSISIATTTVATFRTIVERSTDGRTPDSGRQ